MLYAQCEILSNILFAKDARPRLWIQSGISVGLTAVGSERGSLSGNPIPPADKQKFISGRSPSPFAFHPLLSLPSRNYGLVRLHYCRRRHCRVPGCFASRARSPAQVDPHPRSREIAHGLPPCSHPGTLLAIPHSERYVVYRCYRAAVSSQ